jgi:hypothetical protein
MTVIRKGNRSAHELWANLEKLRLSIHRMIRLESFSFSIVRGNAWRGFWIPRPLVAKLVSQLPPTCINLELDMNNFDATDKASDYAGNSEHLCESICQLLPQLQYLRLRVASLCPSICRNGTTQAPNLLQLIIRMDIGSTVDQTKVCGTYEETALREYSPPIPSASSDISKCLRLLWENQHLPKIKTIYVIEIQRTDFEYDPTTYEAYIRRNISANNSQSLPRRKIGIGMEDFLIRTEIQDYVSAPKDHVSYVEDDGWVESTNGVRLPFPMMESRNYIRRPVLVRDREAYEAPHDGKKRTCQLWHNEDAVGHRVLFIEQKDGVTGLVPTRSNTPEGWERQENNEKLFPRAI